MNASSVTLENPVPVAPTHDHTASLESGAHHEERTRTAFADSAGTRPRLVVAMTGASAPQLCIHLLTALRELGTVDTHLIMSAAAHRTLELETGLRPADVTALADVTHRRGDIAASIASGSFHTMGMVVVPCSMRSLAAIAHGFADDLVTRAADVTLKERRKLVLVTRETPLNLIHLRNMAAVTEAGALILPPMLAFYQQAETVSDLLGYVSGRILDQFGIEHDLYRRWEGAQELSKGASL